MDKTDLTTCMIATDNATQKDMELDTVTDAALKSQGQIATQPEKTAPFVVTVNEAALKGHSEMPKMLPATSNTDLIGDDFILADSQDNEMIPSKKAKLETFQLEFSTSWLFHYPPISHKDATNTINSLQATLLTTITELNAKKAAFPNCEIKERSSLVQKAGRLTQEHDKIRRKLKTDLENMENERDDIIAVKKNKQAKEQTLLDNLKSECVANKNPTFDELNLMCSQQDVVRKCGADISRITKEWDDQIGQSAKLAEAEKEKINKELLQKLEKNYDSIELWKAKYERTEFLPLINQIKKINQAKMSIKKWQKIDEFIDTSMDEAMASLNDGIDIEADTNAANAGKECENY